MPQSQNWRDGIAFRSSNLRKYLVQYLRIDPLVETLSAIGVGGVDDSLPLVYPARVLRRATRPTSDMARFNCQDDPQLAHSRSHSYGLTHDVRVVDSARTPPIALGVIDSPSVAEGNTARCCLAIRL
jgi:hypothetical protein